MKRDEKKNGSQSSTRSFDVAAEKLNGRISFFFSDVGSLSFYSMYGCFFVFLLLLLLLSVVRFKVQRLFVFAGPSWELFNNE